MSIAPTPLCFSGTCQKCVNPIVNELHKHRVRDLCGIHKLAWGLVDYVVCSCEAPPPDESLLPDWLKGMGNAVKNAKLRHDLNEMLPPELKPFGDFFGMLIDPAGAAADIVRKYLEKEAAKRKAAPKPKPPLRTRAQRPQRRNLAAQGKVRVKIPSDWEAAQKTTRKKKRKTP